VTGLAAAVAGLARGVQWAAVGSSAVTGDVTELSAGVALHGLSLAIAGEVVGSTALVAHRGTTAAKASTATGEATTWSTSTTSDGSGTWSRAVTREMSSLAARVALTAARATAQAQSRAIGLNMTETLAVVALLGVCGSWVWAVVALVSGLLAVVAQTLTAGADLGVVTDVAALVAGTARKGRHDV